MIAWVQRLLPHGIADDGTQTEIVVEVLVDELLETLKDRYGSTVDEEVKKTE